MTDYTTLADADLAQDKPVTQAKARALRDNPLAIAEGSDTAPRISTKAINSQYCYVRRTTDYGWSGVGASVIQFNSEVYNPDSTFSSTTYRFTPTVAGLYLVYAKLTTDDNIDGQSVSLRITTIIRKNGTNFATGFAEKDASDTKEIIAEVTAIVQMNGSTDYLDVTGLMSFNNSHSVQGEMWVVGLCES